MSNGTDTAVVFIGEFRTFPICRPTMKFLDQQMPKIDVYVSTWDITTTVNNLRRGDLTTYHDRNDYVRDISGSEIKHMFNNCKVVKIQDFSELGDSRYGSPIINHWRWGLDLVRKSGIKYDYVLILRPDLFFSPNSYFNLEKFSLYKNAIGTDPKPTEGIMTDTVLFSEYNNICKFIDNFDSEFWHTNKLGWHDALYQYATRELDLSVIELPITGRTAIGRYGIEESWSIDQVESLYQTTMHNR